MKNILVTGCNGFIGSCLFEYLIKQNKYNVFGSDYIKDNIMYYTNDGSTYNKDISDMDIIVHLGAISSTNANNKIEIFKKNIFDTFNLINSAKKAKIIYASSASVYGSSEWIDGFSELSRLKPYSLYAKSKSIIDETVMAYLNDRKIVGLRFFNVCSFDAEEHKSQPSPTFKFLKQLKETSEIKLFYGSEHIYRDFIYIDDVVSIINFFIDKEINRSYIVNVGTGIPVSFEEIADKIIEKMCFGKKVYINRPDDLSLSYQEFTKARIDLLRNLGYKEEIPSIIERIDQYI